MPPDRGGMLGYVAVVVGTLICTFPTGLLFACCLGWAIPLLQLSKSSFATFIAMVIGSAFWIAVVIFWGRVNYYIWNTPPSKTLIPQLTQEAEQDARAKFLPSSDTVADDASIQPDKQGLKPGDRRPRPL